MVLYAQGLGITLPGVPEGQLTPSAPLQSTSIQYGLSFSYAEGGGPAATAAPSSDRPPVAAPIFAGLTPGQVGLYQINFVIPSPPFAAPSCGADGGGSPNLTISVYSATPAQGHAIPSDTAAVCVATAP